MVPPAPLQPVPAIGEPFEHVIINCVGPLPRTKSGNQFLLTIMCSVSQKPFLCERLPRQPLQKPCSSFLPLLASPKLSGQIREQISCPELLSKPCSLWVFHTPCPVHIIHGHKVHLNAGIKHSNPCSASSVMRRKRTGMRVCLLFCLPFGMPYKSLWGSAQLSVCLVTTCVAL